MKETLIKRKVVTFGEEILSEMELSYILCEKESEEKTRYGIRIVKEGIENGAGVFEDNTTDLLFNTYTEAVEFMNIIIKYEVTPIALESVLEDYFFAKRDEISMSL